MPKPVRIAVLMAALLITMTIFPSLALSQTSVADGLYTIAVDSSSEMFKVVKCVLRVEGGKMTGMLTLSGKGYAFLYPGTGEQAAAAPESDWIPSACGFEGEYIYTMEIPKLDAAIPVAAYSRRKETWYDRTLTFISKTLAPCRSLAPDGRYQVAVSSDAEQLSGAMCDLWVKDAAMTATLPISDGAVTAFDFGAGEIAAGNGQITWAIDSLDTKIPFRMRVGGVWKEHWLLLESLQAAPRDVKAEDGVYTIDVKSDSGLFRVTACELIIEGGLMRAKLTVENAKYDLLYLGSAAAALNAGEQWICAAQNADGSCSFAIDLPTLDHPVSIATHSPAKDMWYDRTLTFLSETMAPAAAPASARGEYAPDGFSYWGGTGRVKLSCEKVRLANDAAWATVVFSSPKYTRVTVDGAAYPAATRGDTAAFEIPVTLNADMEIVATTTAMSKPTDIAYHIRVDLNGAKASAAGGAPDIPGLIYDSAMELAYAQCFQVYRYEGGYSLIEVKDSARYLVVPQGAQAPAALPGDVVVIKKPIENIYLAATSAMALFDAMDALSSIRLTGTAASGWYIENAVSAMESGDILFAGKYSEPDFEMLLREKCGLAIESTMILHNPNVKEMIELLGIPVFIDRSSYETEPLGRTEWIKLYGVLADKEDKAQAFFDGQAAVLENPQGFENTGKTVAFFYMASDGSVVVRNTFDYVTKMIELAGGVNAFAGVISADETRASVSISLEDFYAAAVNADFLVYNATIDDPLSGMEQLLSKGGGMFEDFKAVRQGNVWCTGKYLYQATDVIGNLIGDFHGMLTGAQEGMTFLNKVK